jgi:hypothetical protein
MFDRFTFCESAYGPPSIENPDSFT